MISWRFAAAMSQDMKLMRTVCKGGLGLGVQFNAQGIIKAILKIGPAGERVYTSVTFRLHLGYT